MEAGYFIQGQDIPKMVDEIVERVTAKLAKMKLSEDPLTKDEAAMYFRISIKTLEQRIKDGKLPTSLIHRNQGTVLFYKSELETYVKSL